MQSERAIQAKVQEIIDRRLAERKRKYLRRGYMNCRHNARHRTKRYGKIGFCHNGKVLDSEKRVVVICNEDDTACTCEHYEPKHTEESVRADFYRILANPSQCGQEYPKIWGFLWCLQQDGSKNNKPPRSSRLWDSLRKVVIGLFEVMTLQWLWR